MNAVFFKNKNTSSLGKSIVNIRIEILIFSILEVKSNFVIFWGKICLMKGIKGGKWKKAN